MDLILLRDVVRMISRAKNVFNVRETSGRKKKEKAKREEDVERERLYKAKGWVERLRDMSAGRYVLFKVLFLPLRKRATFKK